MKKFLIVQTAFPGDAILTLPLIQYIKKKHPDSLIDVIAIPSTESIFNNSPYVNDVIILEKRNKHKSLFNLIKFARQLRKKKYSTLISPHRSFRSSLLVLFSGIKDSKGFDKASLSFVYKRLIKYNPDIHEVKRNLSLFEENISNWKILPEVDLKKPFSEYLSSFIEQFSDKKFIAIAPGSVWETKKYPEENFLKIAEFLISKNYNVVFIGGSADEDLCSGLAKKAGEKAISVAGKLNFCESVELFKHCRLVISNDSAPTHLALAANVNVLTIYCSTIPEFGFYPYSEKSRFISDNSLSCKPCGIHGHKVCPEQHFKCGHNLLPSIVIKEIESLNL